MNNKIVSVALGTTFILLGLNVTTTFAAGLTTVGMKNNCPSSLKDIQIPRNKLGGGGFGPPKPVVIKTRLKKSTISRDKSYCHYTGTAYAIEKGVLLMMRGDDDVPCPRLNGRFSIDYSQAVPSPWKAASDVKLDVSVLDRSSVQDRVTSCYYKARVVSDFKISAAKKLNPNTRINDVNLNNRNLDPRRMAPHN